MKTLGLSLTMVLMFSCIEPDNADNIKKEKKKGEVSLKSAQTTSDLAIKNFLQVNNTYSKLTGISPNEGDILDEYQAIQLQLPSSTDPKTLNGFNQIASTRLAFAYCNEYIDANEDDYNLNSTESNRTELISLSHKFVDFDFNNNNDHKNFLTNLEAILSDEDELVNDANAERKKKKLLKMSCAAILSSTYVTMF
ncbi:MAG: hypothetical protein VYA54_05735 [Bdellovibrionota bacterium]|nr:hypothetical protein [Bdellovibrionota bacterium]